VLLANKDQVRRCIHQEYPCCACVVGVYWAFMVEDRLGVASTASKVEEIESHIQCSACSIQWT
jgi:hypothetical protein